MLPRCYNDRDLYKGPKQKPFRGIRRPDAHLLGYPAVHWWTAGYAQANTAFRASSFLLRTVRHPGSAQLPRYPRVPWLRHPGAIGDWLRRVQEY